MGKSAGKRRNPEEAGGKIPKTISVEAEIVDLDQYQLTPISQKGTTIRNPIYIDEYDDEHISQRRRRITGNKRENGGDEDSKRLSFSSPLIFETGQSSSSSNRSEIGFVCQICFEFKSFLDWFKIQYCRHNYCKDCIIKHVESKLQVNETSIFCPQRSLTICMGQLRTDNCQSQLPTHIFDRWRNALRENGVNEYEITRQSSSPPNWSKIGFVCQICFESKSPSECFKLLQCIHVYCKDCMIKYVVSKLQVNETSISCPQKYFTICKGQLVASLCRSLLPKHIFDRWCNALRENSVAPSKRLYCPFKDCSWLLTTWPCSKQFIGETECPKCRRLFCAQCKVSWHAGISCTEFQTLYGHEIEKEDVMFMKLAQDLQFARCPYCRFYVEKKSERGCDAISCRCGRLFCYKCSVSMSYHAICKYKASHMRSTQLKGKESCSGKEHMGP